MCASGSYQKQQQQQQQQQRNAFQPAVQAVEECALLTSPTITRIGKQDGDKIHVLLNLGLTKSLQLVGSFLTTSHGRCFLLLTLLQLCLCGQQRRTYEILRITLLATLPASQLGSSSPA